MSRICKVSGTRRNKSNKVSFSNKHHRFFQQPNLQTKRVWHPEKKQFVRIRVTAKVIKAITKYGLMAALKRYESELQAIR
ncbi:MAG: 50S ribosomal protein L28 [Candidatus Melainabacteria bacterium]|nr:50S ribosomal protein L28 [Candidatus Melainabacteria bacterium]